MIMEIKVEVNMRDAEVLKQCTEAAQLAMRDTVVEVANDAIKESPVLTGNNRRSIFFGVAGMGHQQASAEGKHAGDTWTGEDTSVLGSGIEGAVYSTSGYGGYLETGTGRMAAQPYLRPALDRNYTADKFASKMKEYL